MQINLNMFGALTMYRVGGHVECTDVVTADQGGTARRGVKLTQELAQPGDLCHSVGHAAVLYLCTGPRHSLLAFGGPGDKAVPEEHGLARGGLARIRTDSPVSVGVNNQLGL